MANNTTLNAGSGGDTIRDLDKGGVKTPVVTLDLGGAGAESLIAGAMPVTGTFWQATQPISAASLPLPGGASTAAKQPAIGTAGTASSDVLTVQGIASMTALKVDGSDVTQPVSIASALAVAQATASSLNATVVGTGAFLVQAQQSGTWDARAQDGSGNALTSLSVGAQRALTIAVVDASGNQVTSFGGSGGTASNFTSSFPATGTAAGFSDGSLMEPARVFDLDSGAGAQYVLGVNLRGASSGGSVELATGTNPLRVDPTGATTQPVSDAGGSLTVDGTVTANIGTSGSLALDSSVNGLLLAQGGTTLGQSGPMVQAAVSSVAPGYANGHTSPLSLDTSGNLRAVATLAAGTNTIGATTPAAATSGGATPYHLISAASTNATSVKGSAGVLYAAFAFNSNASVRYLKLFDKSSAPTLGTDTPVLTYPIPPSSGGVVVPVPVGMQFSSGIALALTTGISDADTGAVGANDVVVNLAYK